MLGTTGNVQERSFIKNYEMAWKWTPCDMLKISNLIFNKTMSSDSSGTDPEEIIAKSKSNLLRVASLNF